MDKSKADALDDAVLRIVQAVADIISGQKKMVVKTLPSVTNATTGVVVSPGVVEVEVKRWDH